MLKSLMKNLHLILFLFLAAHFNTNAQSDSLGYPQYDQSSKNNGLNVRPIFGFGTGSMAYFGDLYRYKGTSPIMGNWAINLSLGARITNYLDVQFNYSYGWLSYHENTPERSDNFKSIIKTSGLVFTYNFNNFFEEQPTVNPIFILGVESVEFNSTNTDLRLLLIWYPVFSNCNICELGPLNPNAVGCAGKSLEASKKL